MSLDEALDLFRTWAPESSRWSAWAKPVLFTYVAEPEAHLDAPSPEPGAFVDLDLRAVPAAGNGIALIVDLPGSSGIACARGLAERGYRPVPLYNATTGPGADTVNVQPLLVALRRAAPGLATLDILADAPPAFLIDSRRLDGTPGPAMYDNRWMVFPQDFPSARALADAGLNRVVVIRHAEPMRADLRAVLRLWKREGIESSTLDAVTGESTELTHDLSLWAVMSDHLAGLWNGLRENSAGGFGGTVPKPQATSGGYRGFGSFG